MTNMNCKEHFNWSEKQLVPVQGFGWLPACVQGEVGDRFKVAVKIKLSSNGRSKVYN